MVSGQEKAVQNQQTFVEWAASMTDETFRQMVRGGKLNRSEIIKCTGIGRSAFDQNKNVRPLMDLYSFDKS